MLKMNRPYNERISIYNGMASTVALNITNTFFPLFMITILGASNYQVGLLSSLPPLIALLMTIPTAILLNKSNAHKRLVGTAIITARLFFLAIVFVVYLRSPLRSAGGVWGFFSAGNRCLSEASFRFPEEKNPHATPAPKPAS